MSPDLRLRLHATQAQPCFPAASNALALPGGNGIFTATPTERITHYTLLRKVVCQMGALPPLETPTRKGGTLPLHGAHTAFSCYPALRLYRLSKSPRGIDVVSLTLGNSVKLLTTTTTTSTDDVDENDSDDTEDSNQHHTGKALSVLSKDAATAVSVMANKEDRDADDYTYVESQPWDNVTEIKLYDEDSDKLVDTYRYDKKNDILAKYDDATSKFVEVK